MMQNPTAPPPLPVSRPTKLKKNQEPVAAAVQSDRLAEPVDNEQRPRLPFTIVGIGASAGGLEALSDFFQTVTPKLGLAFVVVQHLAPHRESLLAEILATQTTMPVIQVKDGLKPK